MIINSTSEFLQIQNFGGEADFEVSYLVQYSTATLPATVFARKYSQNFNPRQMPAFLS